MLPNPFCPITGTQILALRATVLLLLTLLIKARVRIAAFSTLGIVLLALQTLLFLAVSGTVAIAGAAALLYTGQQRRRAVA